jgi:hypothetical protein
MNEGIFLFLFVRVSPEGFSTTAGWFRISLYFWALNQFFVLRIEFEYVGEVQISLDFIEGQRSIVTFRFSAGDTMMRGRIYASRGMRFCPVSLTVCNHVRCKCADAGIRRCGKSRSQRPEKYRQL